MDRARSRSATSPPKRPGDFTASRGTAASGRSASGELALQKATYALSVHDPKALPAPERTHYLYAVMDIERHDFDINFGIGRGDSNAADNWIAKTIIAFPFK